MKKHLIIRLLLIALIMPVVSWGQIAGQQAGALPFNFNPTQETGRVSSKILIGPDGERILIGTGPAANINSSYILPKDVSKNYREAEFSGYLVELKQLPLLEIAAKRVALSEEKLASLGGSLEEAKSEKERESIKKQINNLIQSDEAAVKAPLLKQKAAIQKEQDQAESDIKSVAPNIKIKRKFSKAFNGFSVEKISDKNAQKLKSRGYKISPNYIVKADLMDSVPLIGADKVWAEVKDSSGRAVTGQGVKIGIIDTGVDYTHSDLGGCLGASCKVVGGYDFVNDDSDPYDDAGHGTHVASIVAGNGVLKGVAPDASIYAFKVLDAFGNGYSDDIIAGIERAIDPNQDGDFSDHLDVINLSLGIIGGNPDDPSSVAIDRAVSNGVVAVVAAGNEGPYLQSIRSPGTARKAITVAASDKQDYMASFSSRGPVVWDNKSIVKPDITAPGVNICAAQWNNWLPANECLDDKHIAINGTSMASPHIAGAAALIRQYRPRLSPLAIKYSLRNNAFRISGNSPLDQGTGIVDVLKSVRFSRALIAGLNPIPTTKSGTLYISGFLRIKDFKQYTISYAPVDSDSFVVLTSTAFFPPNGKLKYSFNLDAISDGPYILKLSAEDTSGRETIDYGYFNVDKLEIINPLGSDILRASARINLRARKLSSGTLNWSYSVDSASWTSISGNIWNTKGLNTGVYSLKATVTTGSLVDNETIKVYLDSTLRAGWPQRIAWEKECFPTGECFYYWSGFLEPVVSDIDNNGDKEIIILKGGAPPKLMVYRANGTLLWSKNVGTQGVAGGNLSIPLVGDINNDGKKEIFVINPFDGIYAELYALQSDGSLFTGWSQQPVELPKMYKGYMLMSDLNLDGKNEIVVKPGAGLNREMSIVDVSGIVISKWSLPSTNWSASIEASPVVGNFDDDTDLEIVVADPSENAGGIWEDGQFKGWNNEGIISVFNPDGSLVSGWPIKTKGVVFSSPAVGDINKDGKDEIIVGLQYASEIFPEPELGGIYVFDRNGSILPGLWPQYKGYNFLSSPSLGDIDSDGDLEIGTSRLGFETYLFNHDGTLISGWPQQTSWNDYYSTIRGDINGDSKPDLLTTAGNYWYGGGGGVYAWSTDGQLISGFPKATEVDAQAPAVISNIDKSPAAELIASSDYDFSFQGNKYKNRGSLYVWKLDDTSKEETFQWPTFLHDEQRTGYYPPPTPSPTPMPSLATINFVVPGGIINDATTTTKSTQIFSASIVRPPGGGIATSTAHWSSDREGYSGPVSATAFGWLAQYIPSGGSPTFKIPLQSGANVITFTVMDQAGRSAEKSVTVTKTAPTSFVPDQSTLAQTLGALRSALEALRSAIKELAR